MDLRATKMQLRDDLSNYATRADYQNMADTFKHYTLATQFDSFKAESEVRQTRAEEYLQENYFNKAAIEGLLKSLEEQVQIEYFTLREF